METDELAPLLDRLPPALRGPQARRLAAARRGMLRLRLRLRDGGPTLRRAVDLVASFVGLVVAAPLLALAAVLIKVSSPGPVLFPQERIGHQGRRFTMLKLRTMRVDGEALKSQLAAQMHDAIDGVRFKLRCDPRVTVVGRWLRKYSVDELPQLWNVLRGDMTLIGPRPALPDEVSLYDGRALRRLEVKPGLTCLWQIMGRSDLTFEQQVDLDLEYIDRVSPTAEVAIVARTIPAVLSGRGSY